MFWKKRRGHSFYAYHTNPDALDLDPKEPYARMLVARSPKGRVLAAGWDCAETRMFAKRWYGYGLNIEMIERDKVRELAAADEQRHVFGSPPGTGVEMSGEALGW